jgi:hypothetical protein
VGKFQEIKQETVMALQDAGMDDAHIEQFLKAAGDKQWDKAKYILAAHRSRLLSQVHEGQDKIYCLDFITRKLKAEKHFK